MNNDLTFMEWLNNKQDFIETLKIPDSIIGESDLKTMLKVKYGQRRVFRIFQDMTGKEVANYINNMYNDKWEWLSEFIENSFDIGETNRKTVTENYTNELTGEQSGTNTNKESAYNTDMFVNSEQVENSGNSKNNQKGNRTRTESYQSYYTSLQQLRNVNSDSMLELVLQDIQKEMCLQIY